MSLTAAGSLAFVETHGWEERHIVDQAQAAGFAPLLREGPASELTQEERDRIEVLSCFIRSEIDEAFLATCPSLRVVATRSTGLDHIDLDACKARGITVCNVPQYGENTVAEHTFGLILALARNVYQAVDRMKRGDASIDGLCGFDLYGKTLGVVGTGRIGLRVIRIARAFNMHVHAFDGRPQPLLADVLGFEYSDLDRLLAESDVVSLHLPLLPETHHLIGARELALMKPTAVLVNTSRGGLVDGAAALEALNAGRLAGLALDVLESEQVISEDSVMLHGDATSMDELRLVVESYRLIHHPKVIVTPHIGFYSREALQRIVVTTLDNITSTLAGTPTNRVA